MPFSSPDEGSKLPLDKLIGSLLAIWARKYETNVKTEYKSDADVVHADVVVLDDPGGPEEFPDIRLWQSKLIQATKRKVGKDPVLGRLRMGEKKPGRNPAYLLEAATSADLGLAEAYLAEHGDDPFTSSASTSEMSKPLTLSQGEQDDLLGLGDEL